MILWLLAVRDTQMLDGVTKAQRYYGAIAYYGTINGALPKVGIDEAVKIFAHGNEYEIGEAVGDPSWTPQTLARTLYEYLLPQTYKGEINIDACGSGVMDGNRLTFVDKLLHEMRANYDYSGKIFGYGGNVRGFGANEIVEAAGGDLPAGWMMIQAVDRGYAYSSV